MNVTVRPAEASDEQPLMEMLVAMHGEARAELPGPNMIKSYTALHDMIETEVVITALNEQDEIVGALGLKRNEWWFSDVVCLFDRFFYVVPAARASYAANLLIDAGGEYSTGVGLNWYFANTSGIDIVRKEKFLRRKGFIPIGGVYLRRA